MRNLSQLTGLLLVLVIAGGEARGGVSVPGGYTARETDVPVSIWFGGFDYLPDGRVIVSDSEDVFILKEGGENAIVAHFEAAGLFGSFVKVAPDGHMVYVGESSLGTVSAFDLNAGGIQPIGPGTESVIATVELHYDMEFDPQGRAFLSAATPDTWQPNRLLLLDTESGETELIAIVQGNSGPLVFDDKGNLLTCTSTSYPPEAVESVIVFSADSVEGAMGEGHLTEADAQTYISGIYGFYDMVFDSDGDLFGVTSSGEIAELSMEEEEVVQRSFASVSPNGVITVRFLRQPRPFEPYYENGGMLTFFQSDFWSVFRLVHVTTIPEFRVISLAPEEDGTTVRFATEEGKRYQVYWSGDLGNGGEWEVLGGAITGTGQPVSVLDDGSGQVDRLSPELPSVRRRFYRIESQQ